MKTLQKQIFRNGEDTSMCSQEGFLVSLSVLPESERERKITAISGAKCYEQYAKFSPLGLLAKTLMESSQWYSPAKRLRWDVQTICSTRISYTERNRNSQLKPSVKTLKVQDIPSNRLLFQLVPSEHPTEETGCGLLQDLMPTPIASDAQGGAAKLTKGRRLRNGKVFSATLKDLAASKMLPTPQTQGLKVCNKDGKDGISELGLTIDTKCERWAKGRNEHGKSEISQEKVCRAEQFNGTDSPQGWWRNFPTQSPVCNRDDGLPFRLANLTISFPKWRRKSIEALGNAWVPQVAYQVFQAIENYDK